MADLLSSLGHSFRRKLAHSVQGDVYDQDWLKVLGRFLTPGSGFKDEWIKEIQDKWYRNKISTGEVKPWKEGDLESGRRPEIRVRERIDMIMLASGEPQKYNSIRKSKYRPTRGAEPQDEFYTFTDKNQIKKVYEGLKHLLPKMEKGKSYNVGSEYHVKYGESSFINPGVVGMGKYQISKGEDEKGKYLAVYDKWDIDAGQGEFVDKISDWVMPGFEIYDRVYYEKKKKHKKIAKPEKKKRIGIDDRVFGFVKESGKKLFNLFSKKDGED